MDVFVIYRSYDDGKTQHEWWPEEGYNWVESGALAKWFHSEEEAVGASKKIYRMDETQIFIGRYDPVAVMLNPSETDKNAVLQDHLRSLLRKARG